MARVPEDVRARMRELVSCIRRYSVRYVSGKVENILLVGKTGVGKSGTVNTIAKVVNGEYFQIAPMGSDGIQSKSLELLTARMRTLASSIRRYSERYVSEKVENILLVGRTGVGKSGTVNTIAKVVNGEYFQIAPMGSDGIQSKSLELLTYINCGARTDIPLLDEEDDATSIREIRTKLPNLIDFAGLGDVDTPELAEKFDLLIQGYIPPGVTYQALDRDQTRYKSLKEKYCIQHDEWKVTKVVYVHSCREAIPKNLIQCILRAMRSTDEDSDVMRYTGGVFLLITKYDLVESTYASRPEEAASRNDTVSLEDFRDVEKELARLFSITGNLEFNRLRWVNYCTETGYDNEHIDVIVLEFLKQMMMPTIPRDFAPPTTPFEIKLKLWALQLIESMNLTRRDIIGLIIISLLAVVIIRLLLK